MTKRILITCATGDIGKAACENYAKKHAKKIKAGKPGYELVITARDTAKLKSLALGLAATYNVPVKTFSCDFVDMASFNELIKYFLEPSSENSLQKWQVNHDLHGVVLLPPRPNAVDPAKPTPAEMAAMNSICVDAPYQLIEKLIPALEKQDPEDPARVVYPGGLSSIQPLGDNLITNSWRGAMLNIFKTLANRYGSSNILFNTLSFGQVVTEKFLARVALEAEQQHTTPQAIMAQKTANVPTGKYTSLKSAAKLITFFTTGGGSINITGENLGVTGGFTKRY